MVPCVHTKLCGQGNISRVSHTEYIAQGLFTCSGNDEVHITQIPLHKTWDEYKSDLKLLKKDTKIKVCNFNALFFN